MSSPSMPSVTNDRADVTVIVPTHNRARLLGRAVASVQRQTVDGWELVCVDDASTDDTAAVIEAVADPRIRLIRLPRNGGAGRARNRGVATARGDYVAFLDDDNEWLPEMLDAVLARARSSAAAVLYALAYRHNDATGRLSPPIRKLHEGDVFDRLVLGWNPWISCTVVRRAALLEVGGFDEELAAFQDYDLLLRLAAQGAQFAGVARPLVIRHEHHGRALSGDVRALEESRQRLDAKWRGTIERRTGRAVYRQWRARLASSIEFVAVRRAIARGERLSALRRCAAMGRFSPWSHRFVLHALALAVLGGRGYETLARGRDRALGLWQSRRRGSQ